MLSSATLPKDRRRGNRKNLLCRIGSFYLAVVLFVLTACVELLHTCTPQWLFPFTLLNPVASGSGCLAKQREAQGASACLACLLLHALNATKAAILSLALSWLIFLHNVVVRQRSSRNAAAAMGFLTRAPPCYVLAR